MRKACIFWTFLLLLCSIFFEVQGAEFYRRQAGTTTVAAGNTTQTVTIAGVDLEQSFLVFTSRIDDDSPTNFHVGGELTNSTTITFERTGTANNMTISWEVFEFDGGVFVQRGSELNVARSTNVDIPLECIDPDKSFVLISLRQTGTTLNADDGVTADITSSTNLRLFINGGALDMTEVYWQVITYNAAVVKKVTASLPNGTTSTTSTISPAITDLSKAFVISNHNMDGNFEVDDLPRVELTNTTTVTYTRNEGEQQADFVTYVIEFTDGTTVTRGTENFGVGLTQRNVTTASSVSTGVFAPGQYGKQGSVSNNGTDNIGYAWATFEIISATVLQITRGRSGESLQMPWQLVTFEDSEIQQATFYSFATGDWEDNTSWSFTPDGSSGAVPTGVYPTRRDNVVIQNTHVITIDAVTDNGPCSESPDGLGRSNVGTFTGSGDQMFYHTGDIIVANGGTLNASEEVMLEGYTLVENGGDFTISEDIINLGYLEVEAGATFDNTDDLILSGNSITIINNTVSGSDDIYMDHTDATLCGDGTIDLGNGGADPTVQYLNGATSAQICEDITITCNMNCGGFSSGPPSGTFGTGIIGPGGVGKASDNVLWLSANLGFFGFVDNDPVSSWPDRSGNSNDASQATGSQQPLFQSSVMNGRPALQFDNTAGPGNDLMVVSDADNLDNASGMTIYSVTQPSNLDGSNRYIVSKRVSAVSELSYSLYYGTGDDLFVDFETTDDQFNTVGSFSNATDYIISYVFDGSLAAANRSKVYNNGTLDVTSTETSSSMLNRASDLHIGSADASDGNPFGGYIAELAIYRRALNDAQRVMVDNYFASKYDITLGTNDLYTMDDAGNGDYDFQVAGIGQAADGSNHRDARGPGIVRMWNPDDLANSEYLLWGNDYDVYDVNNVDVDGTQIEERLERVWRISESGDVGEVSVSFDFNAIGNPLGSNLRLMIDRDGDGFADNDVTPIIGTYSAGIASFSGVDFQDGDYFTIGNMDASIALPIELIDFNVDRVGNEARVRWTTASEVNNDYFSIQRSIDALEWMEIGRIQGQLESIDFTKYEFWDRLPLSGLSYYRLKQTDIDESFSFSKIRALHFGRYYQVEVYPNPSDGIYNVRASFDQNPRGILVSADGRTRILNLDLSDGTLDLRDLASGIYFLKVFNEEYSEVVRIVKK